MGYFCKLWAFLFSLCFVTNCQKGSLLGSNTLGLNVLEHQFALLANHDQNVLVFFRLAQSMWLYVKLESSSCRIYYVNLPSSIDWELDSIDRSLCRLFFCRNFQLDPNPFDVSGFMFCLKYKRDNSSRILYGSLYCVCESFVRSRGVCLHTYLGFPRFKIMSRTWWSIQLLQ